MQKGVCFESGGQEAATGERALESGHIFNSNVFFFPPESGGLATLFR